MIEQSVNNAFTVFNNIEVQKIRDLTLGGIYVYIQMLFQEDEDNMRLSILIPKLSKQFGWSKKKCNKLLLDLFDLDVHFLTGRGHLINIMDLEAL